MAQDLAALAAQFGGKPVEQEQDLVALAKQFGGSVQEAPKQESKPQGKSIRGFLSNAPSSLGNVLKDTATGLYDVASFAARTALNPLESASKVDPDRVMATLKAAPGAIKDAASQRYGSLQKIGDTLYNDPFGVAADVSSLAGLGATARVPRIAGTLRKIEQATDPLRLVTKPVAAGAREAGNLVVRGTLRPPKAVRESFGGSRGVANAVLDERVVSEKNAQKKLSRSVAEADKLLAEKQAAGTRGVSARSVADSVTGPPAQSAARRDVLGVDGASQSVADRRQRVLDANAVPGQPNATRMIPLTEAQGLKREAQDLAYEATRSNLGLDAQSNQAIARALREGIEQRVPEVKPINERSQRLLGAQKAFEEAQDRPRSLTNTLSLLGGAGAGASSGDPMMAILTAALVKGMDSPRAGAMAGIGINEFGRGLDAAGMRRAALLARLAEQAQE